MCQGVKDEQTMWRGERERRTTYLLRALLDLIKCLETLIIFQTFQTFQIIKFPRSKIWKWTITSRSLLVHFEILEVGKVGKVGKFRMFGKHACAVATPLGFTDISHGKYGYATSSSQLRRCWYLTSMASVCASSHE